MVQFLVFHTQPTASSIIGYAMVLRPRQAVRAVDRFTDTAAILISILSINYYGMLRGQIH